MVVYFCEMKKAKILFVCLGNICRSPAAEAIFEQMASEQGIAVEVDSAGTSAWHAGEKADARMRKHATERGYTITSISRAFHRDDFELFDMIIAMDDQNFFNLRNEARSVEDEAKLYRMRDFFVEKEFDHIPDPYYGGSKGFDLVIDLLEDASQGLINQLKSAQIKG